MMIMDAQPGAVLRLGYSGEKNGRVIRFFLEDWSRLYGPGIAALVACRYGDEESYAVPLIQEGDVALWRIRRADAAIAGAGWCELQYRVDDTTVKAERWVTEVEGSPTDTASDPEEPDLGYMEQILDAGALALHARAEADRLAADAKTAAAMAASAAEAAAELAKFHVAEDWYATTSLGEATVLIADQTVGGNATIFEGDFAPFGAGDVVAVIFDGVTYSGNPAVSELVKEVLQTEVYGFGSESLFTGEYDGSGAPFYVAVSVGDANHLSVICADDEPHVISVSVQRKEYNKIPVGFLPEGQIPGVAHVTGTIAGARGAEASDVFAEIARYFRQGKTVLYEYEGRDYVVLDVTYDAIDGWSHLLLAKSGVGWDSNAGEAGLYAIEHDSVGNSDRYVFRKVAPEPVNTSITLASPDGSKWVITVDDTGTLSASKVAE